MTTYGIILTISVLFLVAALMSISFQQDFWDKAGRYRFYRYAGLSSVILGLVGLLAIWRYGYQIIPETEVGVRWNGIHSSLLDRSAMCWQRECLVFAKNTALEGTVQPITDNPKVRHLKYKIEVTIVDPVLFVRTVQLGPGATCSQNIGDGPMHCQLDDSVMFEIFEFNNANSKELAKFYNPYDQNQTGELQHLMLQKLNPPLIAKGINFKRLVSWSVE